MEAVFVDNVPARITRTEFRRSHLAAFPKLSDMAYDELIDDAISNVYVMFSGVGTLWARLDPELYFEKTRVCYRFLTAWYIADLYPTLTAGVPMMGPIPLKRKKIGMVDITYRDDAAALAGNRNYEDLLSGLKSNVFGGKAYAMIRSSAERMAVRSSRIV
jgi:hypothetical protein